jgi:predicted  nucleic acid-binding Zn-ribbon protein
MAEANTAREEAKAEAEKARVDLEAMKRKLSESKREIEEANKAKRGVESELSALQKWESLARHELEIADIKG